MTHEGREARLQRLFDRYYQGVFAYFIHLGFTREDAGDLAQDVFVGVYDHVNTIRDELPFIWTAARNRAKNEFRHRSVLRHRQARETPEDLAESLGTAANQEPNAIENEQKALRLEKIRNTMADFPPLTRECLLLRNQGLKYREIAAQLGLSMDSVKARLRDGRMRLQERLGEEFEGGDGDDHEE